MSGAVGTRGVASLSPAPTLERRFRSQRRIGGVEIVEIANSETAIIDGHICPGSSQGLLVGWLMPDLPTNELFHPQSREAFEYWKRTLDWRGRASFFRDGYNFAVSTQNFNHTAAMGALLGGALIDAPYAIADGRHCLEHMLLRFWGFLDGSTQEMLDHYYLSITFSAQKMFVDFAPTPIDRLMGRILVDRTMEMLITVYHPGLRRFVAASTRARLPSVLVEQDGIYGALHTVSKAGVLKYLDKPASAVVHGMPVWGAIFRRGG
jgi:hypothetical protein